MTAADIIRGALAPSTQRAYATEMDRFHAFSAEQDELEPGWSSQPMDVRFADYIVDMMRIGRGAQAPLFLAAARAWLRSAWRQCSEVVDDRLETLAQGAKRLTDLRTRDARVRRRPLTVDVLRQVAGAIPPDDPRGLDDLLVLVLSHAMMLRAGELAQLRFGDVQIRGEELYVLVRREKTRATAPKDLHLVPECDPSRFLSPLRLMRTYLERHAGGPDDFLFRTPRGQPLSSRWTTAMIRRRLLAAGWDPEEVEVFASHSLRSGGATDMARQGAQPLVIAAVGGWDSRSGAVQGYVRTGVVANPDRA